MEWRTKKDAGTLIGGSGIKRLPGSKPREPLINSCSPSLRAKRSNLVTSESTSYRLLRHFVPRNDELMRGSLGDSTPSGQVTHEMQAFLTGKIDAMKYLYFGFPLCLLLFPGLASEVPASSWTCQNAGLTRHVVVFYPEAPARLPCKVFYSKPKENVLPHALWKAINTRNYCERKAAEFIEKLSSSGWHCLSDDLEE